MKKKIIGILIVTLLIATVVFPTSGEINSDNDYQLDKVNDSFQGDYCLYCGGISDLNAYAKYGKLDFTQYNSISLSFCKHYNISGENDTFRVGIIAGGIETTLEIISNDAADKWVLNTFDLSAWAGMADIYLIFRLITGRTGVSEIWIDNIQLTCDGQIIYEEYFSASNWPYTGWTKINFMLDSPGLGEKKPEEFILVWDQNDYGIYIIPYNGGASRSFGAPILVEKFIDEDHLTDVTGRIVDFDNDGDFDIVLDILRALDDNNPNVLSVSVYVYENTLCCFQLAWGLSYDDPCLILDNRDNTKVVAGDFNDDGRWDFMISLIHYTATGREFDYHLFENNCINPHVFAFRKVELTSIHTTLNFGCPHDMEAADFDQDGLCDLIISDYPDGQRHTGDIWFYKNGNSGIYIEDDFQPGVLCMTSPIADPFWSMVSGNFFDSNDQIGTPITSVDVIAGMDDDGDAGQAIFFDNRGGGVFNPIPPGSAWRSSNAWAMPNHNEPFDLNTDIESGDSNAGAGFMDAYDFDHDWVLDMVVSHDNPFRWVHTIGVMWGERDPTTPPPRKIDATFSAFNKIQDKTKLLACPEPQIPYEPGIGGPGNFRPNQEKEFTFQSIDPTGDQIFYYIDWGDGNNSGWKGPYASGYQLKISHAWTEKANFIIKCKAKDIYGLESGWGTLEISTSKNKAFTFLSIFEQLFQRFPFFEKILNQIL